MILEERDTLSHYLQTYQEEPKSRKMKTVLDDCVNKLIKYGRAEKLSQIENKTSWNIIASAPTNLDNVSFLILYPVNK